MIHVAIIDDHPLIYEGLKSLLANTEDISLVHYAPNAREGIEMLKQSSLDVVLLDINLPDMNGIDLCNKIKKEYAGVKIIALSTFTEKSYITKMIANGASGYMQKSVSADELIKGITEVYYGGLYFDSATGKIYYSIKEEFAKLPLITPRELQVLKMIADGMTNNEIAEKIFVSSLTVDSHRKNLIAKLNVKNTAALIRYASEHNLL